jgi:hypothetical protein
MGEISMKKDPVLGKDLHHRRCCVVLCTNDGYGDSTGEFDMCPERHWCYNDCPFQGWTYADYRDAVGRQYADDLYQRLTESFSKQ